MSVTKVYSTIAQHFSDTRYSHWKAVKEFILSMPNYSMVLDIGCGNGKYTLVRKDLLFLCFDITPELLTLAKQNTKGSIKDFIHGSCIEPLPVIHNYIDYAICIAVIHHVSNHNDRMQSILNILSTLKNGGSLLVTVWAYEQMIHSKWKHIENTDYLIPWLDKYTQTTYWRYYHLFTEKEVNELCNRIKECMTDVEYKITYERDNWIILFSLQSKNLQ